MNRVKKKDQNFLLPEEEAILSAIHKVIVDFRERRNIKKSPFAEKAGLGKNSLASVEDVKYTPQGARSTIDLGTLSKILNHYPDLGKALADHLSRNTDEKLTSVQELVENEQKARSNEPTDQKKELGEEYRKAAKEIIQLRENDKKEYESRIKICEERIEDCESKIKSLEGKLQSVLK